MVQTVDVWGPSSAPITSISESGDRGRGEYVMGVIATIGGIEGDFGRGQKEAM